MVTVQVVWQNSEIYNGKSKGWPATNDHVVEPPPNSTNSQKLARYIYIRVFEAKFKRHRARKGMNGCFMQQLTHNNTAQQQDTFHQPSGAGVQRTLLQQQ